MLRVPMVSRPPPGIASRAFTTRLVSADSSCAGSTRTGQRPLAVDSSISMCSPSVRSSSLVMPATRSLRSTCLRLQRLAARERQQAAIEIGAAQRRAQRLVDGFGRVGIPADLLAQQVEIADDDGEQVVEVVRQAAGELPDRLHLLALAQLLLQQLAVRDVLDRHHEGAHRAVLVEYRCAGELHVDDRAVLALAPLDQLRTTSPENALARDVMNSARMSSGTMRSMARRPRASSAV